MAKTDLLGAINLALTRAMSEDSSVIVLGEDVGVNGGVFRATDGLLKRFGPTRVLDTPLAEVAIAGLSVGAAVQGLRPVAEIQFSGFIYPAIDQMLNHASRMRNRTRGRLSCPMVLRTPYGGGVHAPEHHSESPEALFAHIPGLRVVIPSSPARAYGLLLAAIRDPDPVVFLEPTRLYHAAKEDVADNGDALALDQPVAVREGEDVTLVSWGAMMRETVNAADEVAGRNIACEVIDVCTLSPFNDGPILESVSRTGRCVIVHEATRTCGFGAEIAARIADTAILSLLAPVKRVTGLDTVTCPCPSSRGSTCRPPQRSLPPLAKSWNTDDDVPSSGLGRRPSGGRDRGMACLPGRPCGDGSTAGVGGDRQGRGGDSLAGGGPHRQDLRQRRRHRAGGKSAG
jgi:pyruvate dehydrogenase E1 component beta subunit